MAFCSLLPSFCIAAQAELDLRMIGWRMNPMTKVNIASPSPTPTAGRMPTEMVRIRMPSPISQSRRIIRRRVAIGRSSSIAAPMNINNPAATKLGTTATICAARKHAISNTSECPATSPPRCTRSRVAISWHRPA